jgi:outer membrane protein assembly factor BamB
MDRRVLFASLILLAGGATGVGVALFAFVGVDDAATDSEVVWETDPVAGDDGSGAVVATMDGDSLVLRSTVEDGERAVRATAVGGDVEWRAPLSAVDGAGGGDGDSTGGEPPDVSALAAGTLDGEEVVAFTTETGSLVVLDAADGATRFTAELGGSGGFRPAIGDITGDGSAEVAAATADGRVLVVDRGGEAVFETSLDEPVDRRPLIVGSEGDESDGSAGDARGVAVATVGDEEATVRLLDANGDVRWAVTPSVTPLSWNAADTEDGPVIALGGTNGNLEALDAADGSSRYEIGLQDLPLSVGETDRGRVHVGGVRSVWAVDLPSGEVIWKQQYGGDTRVNAPGVGTVSADVGPGPVAVNREGEVLALNPSGEAIARGDVGSAVVYAGPLFADVTGDGTDEVLVVTADGRIVALDD